MTNLNPGGNAAVDSSALTVVVSYTPVPGVDLDFSAFVLTTASKVRGDDDMCFFGQKSINGGAVALTDTGAGRAVFTLDLHGVEPAVGKIALTVTVGENKASFSSVSHLSLTLSNGIEAVVPTEGMTETALILGEFYRRQESWKFRCVGQGFAGGLEPLAKHFGVDVATPSAAPTVPVSAKTPISLSKITLDKTRSTISLEKTGAGFGEIKVNLNWNKRSSATSGFFGFKKNTAIDLDVGCLFELQDGSKGAVQALGNAFGQLDKKPYIQLKGDDRTGAASDGEWLHINGAQWQEVKRILVFAFIYEGAPNWSETDGVVTILIPGQPPIEVRLNEEGGKHGMCAIALLENDRGAVKVSRRVDFHKGHSHMDEAYGWGMRWSAGSK